LATKSSQAATYIKGNKIKSNQMKCAYVWRFMSCAPPFQTEDTQKGHGQELSWLG